jgi:hypothetical protein
VEAATGAAEAGVGEPNSEAGAERAADSDRAPVQEDRRGEPAAATPPPTQQV